jgi:glycosyltransferase involved in cell wall biosynthesis
MFVGSGQLQPELDRLAGMAGQRWGVRTTFTGFINQSQLAPYYLAMDVLMLPSRRMGEAWGLVVNEALNAGCAVVISDAVGCYAEFGDLERVRIISVESHDQMAEAIRELAQYPRDFRWAEDRMAQYSTRAAAEAMRNGLVPYLRPEAGTISEAREHTI